MHEALKLILDRQVSRVSKQHLGLVRNVTIILFGRYCRMLNSLYLGQYILGDQADVSNLKSMIRCLNRHFTGLETITFRHGENGPFFDVNVTPKPILYDACTKALVDILELLLKHRCLETIAVFTDEAIPMHKAAQLIRERQTTKAGILTTAERVLPLRHDMNPKLFGAR